MAIGVNLLLPALGRVGVLATSTIFSRIGQRNHHASYQAVAHLPRKCIVRGSTTHEFCSLGGNHWQGQQRRTAGNAAVYLEPCDTNQRCTGWRLL